MDKNVTLVIMAAGMGSRFGGLKQVESMGPNGEFLLDYSIYDAIVSGFNKVVFIIRKENYDLFRTTIGKRIEEKIDVEYVFQEFDDIKDKYNIPDTRVKPLGTAHAILCTKDVVKTPFIIINADDFYGRDSFMKAKEFLNKVDNNSYNYGMIGYLTKNTLTENGSVKRGICKIENNYLKDIIESKVERVNNDIIATPVNGSDSFKVSEDTTVSMNMFLFTPTIYKLLEDEFPIFMENNKDNLETCEYLIPDVLQKNIKNNTITIEVVNTTSKWYGVTYREDKENVVNSLNKLIEEKEYPQNLWKK